VWYPILLQTHTQVLCLGARFLINKSGAENEKPALAGVAVFNDDLNNDQIMIS
jgi:hypothetical protein